MALVSPSTLAKALLFLLATEIAITNTDAFQPNLPSFVTKNTHSILPERIVTQPSLSTSTTLFAGKRGGGGGGNKKRRRRRKDGKEGGKQSNPPPPSTPPPPVVPSSSSVMNTMETDELPDFDLDEDIVDETTPSMSSGPAATTASGATIPPSPLTPSASTPQLDLNDPAVVAAMRSTQSNTGATSTATTGDLLRSRNREMEQKFVVNTVSEEVPDLAQYTKNKRALGGSAAGAGVGKKAQRAAARKAAAIEAKGGMVQEEEESIFSKLPFVGGDKDPDEKLDPLKLLENGTWAGIFALVAWEVYLNSPFFERATSDFAPIVF